MLKTVNPTMPNRYYLEQFRRRMVGISGVQSPNPNTLIMERWTDFTRVMDSWKINPSYLAYIPVNGKCASCSLVPAGQCQEGCKVATLADGTANTCANNNKGKAPSRCTVPDEMFLLKNVPKDDFPYWAFMRVITRNEKKLIYY